VPGAIFSSQNTPARAPARALTFSFLLLGVRWVMGDGWMDRSVVDFAPQSHNPHIFIYQQSTNNSIDTIHKPPIPYFIFSLN
jgi:hypothetical protein